MTTDLPNPKTSNSRKRRQAYLALILNAVIWGAALPIVKPALSHVSPYQYLFLRYAIAAVLSLPILILLIKKYRPDLKTLAKIVLLESLQVTAALSFLYEGLRRTTSLEATLIANAAPIFVILGGVFLLKEKEEKHELAGLILSIAGVTILTLEPLITGSRNLNFSFTGNLLVLGHNFFWASYVLLAKTHYQKLPKLLIGFVSLWVGLASFAVLNFATGDQLTLFDSLQQLAVPEVLLASAYMAVLGSIVAVPAFIFGNNLIEASEASLFTYLQPLITIPLATLWLHEPINSTIILALILTTTGVAIAENRKNHSQKP